MGSVPSAACGGRSEEKRVAAVKIWRSKSEQQILGTATGRALREGRPERGMLKAKKINKIEYRDVAQFGRALRSGANHRFQI